MSVQLQIEEMPDYLIIRRLESKRGDEYTTHSVRAKLSLLDDAMAMSPDAFRQRLLRFLGENDFPVRAEQGNQE